MPLPVHDAVRYVTPLREGGSLPAILETEEGGLYVTKFLGAGQGAPVLVAELVAGAVAERLGLPMPALALVRLPEGFGRTERDPEIQDILKGSRGLNVGLRYLEGALNFDPVADAALVTPEQAADLVWFDAFVLNVDRTPRNPNLLAWRRSLQLIDHGSTLYLHHDWERVTPERIRQAFPPIREHVLLPRAGDLAAADARARAVLDADVFEAVLADVPDALLLHAPEGRTPPFATADEARAAYVDLLAQRLDASAAFTAEARQAAERLRTDRPNPLSYRR